MQVMNMDRKRTYRVTKNSRWTCATQQVGADLKRRQESRMATKWKVLSTRRTRQAAMKVIKENPLQSIAN